jgi:regulator of ribosome biosynthesis
MPAPAAIMSAKGKSRAAGAAEPSQAEKKSTREKRKMELERSMAITRGSTASLGKFDRKIEGEPKVKGVKRKVRTRHGSPLGRRLPTTDRDADPSVFINATQFEPTAPSSFTSEKSTSLSILSSVGKPRPTEKRARVSSGGQGARPEGDVNVRKALRFHGREEARKGKSADRGGKKSGGKKGRK